MAMEKTLFKFILKYSKVEQTKLVFLTFFSFPFLYATLELPKMITNEAIGSTGVNDFPKYIDIPWLHIHWTMEQIQYLLLLSFCFLGIVLLHGGIKFYLNIKKGQVGERMLRRLRYELYTRILKIPCPNFKRISTGEMIPIITAEVENLGGFIGDAYALPLFQGGTLIVYLTFIFIQNPILGLAAIALYPVQIVLIPRLQQRVNRLAKKRIREVRRLADKVHETIQGIKEIQTNDAVRYECSLVAARLQKIYDIRYLIYKRKFFTKFLNNFIAQLTPFFFYSIGGYLVIENHLTFGSLVAILASYKDLAGPWNELLTYYQQKEDIKVKYQQIIDRFDHPEQLDLDLQASESNPIDHLHGDVEFVQTTLAEDGKIYLDKIDAQIKQGKHIAVIGDSNSNKEMIAHVLARLESLTSGKIQLDGRDIKSLDRRITSRRIGYVDDSPSFPSTTLENFLFYPLKHDPLSSDTIDDNTQKYLREAELTGNITYLPQGSWVDGKDLDAQDMDQITRYAIDTLKQMGLDQDVFHFGLKSRIDPDLNDIQTQHVEQILLGRKALRHRLQTESRENLVEFFDMDCYLPSASLAENLVFGAFRDENYTIADWIKTPFVLGTLRKSGLFDELTHMGIKIAQFLTEIFADLSSDSSREFLEKYSFINMIELQHLQNLMRRPEGQNLQKYFGKLKPDDQELILILPFRMVLAKHRLGLLDESIQQKIIEIRKVLRDSCPDELKSKIDFFDDQQYCYALNFQENLLFGKVSQSTPNAYSKLLEDIEAIVQQFKLHDIVLRIGLQHPLGTGGGHLTPVQKQKINLVRLMIKNPDIAILNQPMSGLESSLHRQCMEQILHHFKNKSLLWILNRPGFAKHFDHIWLIERGRLIEQGQFDELMERSQQFKKLVEHG